MTTQDDNASTTNQYIENPLTHRPIKISGRKYNELLRDVKKIKGKQYKLKETVPKVEQRTKKQAQTFHESIEQEEEKLVNCCKAIQRVSEALAGEYDEHYIFNTEEQEHIKQLILQEMNKMNKNNISQRNIQNDAKKRDERLQRPTRKNGNKDRNDSGRVNERIRNERIREKSEELYNEDEGDGNVSERDT